MIGASLIICAHRGTPARSDACTMPVVLLT